MIPRVPAPGSNLRNKGQRQIIRVWYLDGTFAVFEPVCIQLLREKRNSLRPRIKTNVLFLRRIVDDIVTIPVCRH